MNKDKRAKHVPLYGCNAIEGSGEGMETDVREDVRKRYNYNSQ